jgi:hypothetical protein
VTAETQKTADGGRTYTIASIDVPPGKAPSVEFTISDDKRLLTARPEGAYIVISFLHDGLSRVQLWDTERGGCSVDMDLRHQQDTQVEQWRNAMSYVCEVASALYWSQWRSQLAAKAGAR